MFLPQNSMAADWQALLAEEFKQPYMQELDAYLEREYAERVIFPPMYEIFTALKLTSYAEVRVVILGQDPYHERGQAQGLAFSVREGAALPPSLRNILKELSSDLGLPAASDGDLSAWARRGALLLNTVLTVREGEANSHAGCNWERFTDCIITLLNKKKTPVVFLLWGKNAAKKQTLITGGQHLVLCCAHPSPLSAHKGFLGCRHFSKASEFLRQNGCDFSWQL